MDLTVLLIKQSTDIIQRVNLITVCRIRFLFHFPNSNTMHESNKIKRQFLIQEEQKLSGMKLYLDNMHSSNTYHLMFHMNHVKFTFTHV